MLNIRIRSKKANASITVEAIALTDTIVQTFCDFRPPSGFALLEEYSEFVEWSDRTE